MKQNYLKKLMAALLLLCSTVASAQDFEVDGIYYILRPSEGRDIAAVTRGGNEYSGTVTIPDAVTYNGEAYRVMEIFDRAFEGCIDLTGVVIPESVICIGYYAFDYCTGLTSVTSYIPADKLFVPGEDAFYDVNKTNCTLYVPAGAKAAYAATDG